MTTSEQLQITLEELKLKFFASKYITINGYAKYSGEWPEEFNSAAFSHWNKEKKHLLALQEEQTELIQQSYKFTLMDRLDFSAKLMEVAQNALLQKAGEDLNVKDLATIVRAVAGISDLQDKTITVMKIDPSVNKEYSENANALDSLLEGTDLVDEVAARREGKE